MPTTRATTLANYALTVALPVSQGFSALPVILIIRECSMSQLRYVPVPLVIMIMVKMLLACPVPFTVPLVLITQLASPVLMLDFLIPIVAVPASIAPLPMEPFVKLVPSNVSPVPIRHTALPVLVIEPLSITHVYVLLSCSV